MGNELHNVVRELSTLIGFRAAFASSPSGDLIASENSGPLVDSELAMVARVVAHALDGVTTTLREEEVELELVYQDGRLLAKGFPGLFLCMISDRDVNPPYMYMAMDRATSYLEESPRLRPATAKPTDVWQEADEMKRIAKSALGEHSAKVLQIIDRSSSSEAELLLACDEIERVIRLFIDSENASSLAEELRKVIRS
jgi:hypothetical protein